MVFLSTRLLIFCYLFTSSHLLLNPPSVATCLFIQFSPSLSLPSTFTCTFTDHIVYIFHFPCLHCPHQRKSVQFVALVQFLSFNLPLSLTFHFSNGTHTPLLLSPRHFLSFFSSWANFHPHHTAIIKCTCCSSLGDTSIDSNLPCFMVMRCNAPANLLLSFSLHHSKMIYRSRGKNIVTDVRAFATVVHCYLLPLLPLLLLLLLQLVPCLFSCEKGRRKKKKLSFPLTEHKSVQAKCKLSLTVKLFTLKTRERQRQRRMRVINLILVKK